MLKWDLVLGPVRIEDRRQETSGERKSDAVGRELSLAPTLWRQVGQCVIAQSPATHAGFRFGERAPYSGRARLDLLFCDDPQAHRAICEPPLHGLQTPGERVGWLMTCYELMRDRGRWPVNVVAEQLIADEAVFIEFGEIQRPCSASIQ